MQKHLSFVAVTLVITAAALSAQDADYIRAVERAQQQRPATLTSSGRIAPAGEPGNPLVIHGRVFGPDARTPAPGAVVFAYHTDREGNYDRPGTGAHSWRLRGWATADADGRFELRTIRPGPYPNSRIPAHVHFTIFTPAGERYHAGETQFGDDALIAAPQREASKKGGEFDRIRPVRAEGKTQHVDVHLRIEPRQKF